ncbi:hypothetical protein K2173_019106 [Erythroxylum novogranatense]|uniref:KAT8 regulatory NSL complex subunit 2 n=1 Tax=Erythroxylum novogranatense TaxID=1862640 RepID=A0AAV8SSU6_9ROSI|nr:hypothetical protein K2173_019106 [Erythroxylum novogranatense]
MTSASKNHYHHHQRQQPSSYRPPKIPTSQTNHHHQSAAAGATSSPIIISEQEKALSGSTHLTRQELLKRRSHKLKQLAKCYRDHYWALMEDLKVQYREYYWKYGVSPFKEDQPQHRRLEQCGSGVWSVDREIGDKGGNFNVEVIGENNSGYVNNVSCNFKGDLELKSNRRCSFVGCKLKAMALTSFCHLHILSDAKQKLYKPCGYVIKSAQAGPITCGKPILRSTTPSLCTVHFQRAQTHISRALKKAGLNGSTSNKLAPKFHLIVAEYVHQIQVKRRAAKNENRSNGVKKEANTG